MNSQIVSTVFLVLAVLFFLTCAGRAELSIISAHNEENGERVGFHVHEDKGKN